MKTKAILKIGLAIILILLLGLISYTMFAHKKLSKQTVTEISERNDETSAGDSIELMEDNVSITIDSNTTEKDFADIKKMLKEHQITADFTKIERNDSGKLIGLRIVLKDENGSQVTSEMKSNIPIAQIVFGRKDGALFISPSNKESGAFAFFNQPNMMPFSFDNDSISKSPFSAFGNFNFDDFFNDENDSFFFNGKSLNLDELREKMKKQFESSIKSDLNFFNFFESDSSTSSFQKFRFFDDPNTNKVIIIDGKNSDFKTLDDLARSDKLQAVDVLKPETAISIYGEKAKDGAIIATTKEKSE